MNNANLVTFINVLDEYRGKSFIIGESDCHIICLHLLDELYGTNFKEKVFKQYKTIKKGLKKANELTGFDCLSSLLAEYIEPITQELACSGDIVIQSGKWESVIFHNGDHYVEANEKSGFIVDVPLYHTLENKPRFYRFKGV